MTLSSQGNGVIRLFHLAREADSGEYSFREGYDYEVTDSLQVAALAMRKGDSFNHNPKPKPKPKPKSKPNLHPNPLIAIL